MPSTWPGIEPATLGIEGQRYTNSPTRSTVYFPFHARLNASSKPDATKTPICHCLRLYLHNYCRDLNVIEWMTSRYNRIQRNDTFIMTNFIHLKALDETGRERKLPTAVKNYYSFGSGILFTEMVALKITEEKARHLDFSSMMSNIEHNVKRSFLSFNSTVTEYPYRKYNIR
ncbi:hypothetical protein ANN_21345 [Periplaneta americana]|uniref:Uncharacterized protein n=1 Tax=Periplaneta americana TaxID=6978 RepID=A0ABQ8SFD4_PERAM|nr:hypothetical protein ANN_21345 [Periplaneta americana]